MTRKQFKINLEEAIEFHDGFVTEEEMELFLDLNFDDDPYLANWTFKDFNSFATDIAVEGLDEACRLNNLHYEGE